MSYHQGYVWSDNILAGIKSVLGGEAKEKAELLIEYMDLNRFSPSEVEETLRELYAIKYARQPPSVIIASDDAALNFMLRYGDALFPGVPVVFCGINRYDPGMLAGRVNYTGVVENFDVKGTIELALRLHPKARRVVGVSSEATPGMPNLQAFRAAAKELGSRAEFTELVGLSALEAREALRKEPPGSVIINLSSLRDQEGDFLSALEGARLEAESAAGPVYTCWDFALGSGIVGGLVVSGFLQGAAAAEMALSILHGTRPSDIPVMTESPNGYMFDYNALGKAGLSVDSLPPGSVTLNRPESFYDTYRIQIWLALAVLILMLVLLAAMGANILARRKAQRELRAALDELESIFANSQVGIMLLDAEWRVRKSNARLAEILGYSGAEAMAGAQFKEIMTDAGERAASDDAVAGQVARGEHVQIERRIVRRDGSPIWCQISGKAIDPDTPPDLALGALWVVEDVTERVRSREVMIQTEKMLSVGGLAAGMAHELNNPLGIILAAAQNVERRLEARFPKNVEAAALAGLDLEKLERYRRLRGIDGLLENIRHSGERAGTIIRSMLDFSRQSESTRAPHDLRDLLEQALDLAGKDYDLKKKYDFRAIEIRRDFDPALPKVNVAQTEIVQVFLNLLKNAAQSLARGASQAKPAVTLRTRQVNGFAQAEIKDNGPGVPESIRRRIFEPFFTTKPPGEGTGLGLSVAYFIVVRNHGGELLAHSEEGQGATFIVRLPVHGAAA